MFNFRLYFCFKSILPRKHKTKACLCVCVGGGGSSNLLQKAGTRKRRGVCRWVCRQVAFHHIIHPILTRANIVKYSEGNKRFGIMPC